MESALLGVVLDSSIVIQAELKSLPVPNLVESIQTTYGEIEVSFSPVTVANWCMESTGPGRWKRASAAGSVTAVTGVVNADTKSLRVY